MRYAAHIKMVNTYNILFGKCGRKIPLERSRRKGDNIIKISSKEIVWKRALD
jgi:hypothetical protein